MSKDNNKLDILLNMYNEAWQLYMHEDQLSESRNTMHLAIVSALFGCVSVIISLFVNAIEKVSENHIYVIAITTCIILLLLMIIMITILENWKRVNFAARCFVKAREGSAKDIEIEILKDNDFAFIDEVYEDDEEKDETKKTKIDRYAPLSIASSERHRLDEIIGENTKFIGGFKSTNNIIMVFSVISYALLTVDVLVLIYLINILLNR